MSIFNSIKSIIDNDQFNQLTLGEVIDTNDPQQMGRVRIICPFFGDNEDSVISSLPWATPISPLAGTSQAISRGRGKVKTPGPVSYGMFNVPKVGSTVLVACIEGDPKMRIYLGGMHPQFATHTMPHGRYSYDTTNDKLNKDEPSGPLSSTEDPILPLYDSQTDAFKRKISETNQEIPEPRKSFEFRTRGADYGVSGINGTYVNSSEVFFTETPDDVNKTFTEADGNNINYTFGYNESQIHRGLSSKLTDGGVYDPQVYSWTTPGFHAISMSDNPDNCRIRVRTTHGHQIIMDDTNERVYISTAGGKTWIELDEAGNIDIFGERNISVHAEKDINFTAGDTFRVKAKNGIHMISEGEMRLHTVSGKMHIKSGQTTELNTIGDFSISAPNLFLTADTAVHIKANGGVLNLQSGGDTNVKVGAALNLESGNDMNLLAAGNILQTGVKIELNGAPAGSADSATDSVPANTLESYWTDRVPEHEPWARMMTDPAVTDTNSGNTHADSGEYLYTDTLVGKSERDEDLKRNPKWHR